MNSNRSNKIISINELWQFFNHSSTLFCITGPDGYVQQVNPFFTELFGFSETQILSNPYISFIHDEDKEIAIECSRKLRTEVPVIRVKNRVRTSSGSFKKISWTCTYVPSQDFVYLIGQDYTDSYSKQGKTEKESFDKHKSILEAILIAQEKERTEIGQELHDHISELLTTIALYNKMALTDKMNTVEMVKKSLQVTEQAIAQVSTLSKLLLGPQLKQTTLYECICDLIANIQKHVNIKISFRASNDIESLSPALKLTVFRVLQDHLLDVLNNSTAKRVAISLQSTGKKLTLAIADNGKEKDGGSRKNCTNLNYILSRINGFRGMMDVTEKEGKEFRLQVKFPTQ